MLNGVQGKNLKKCVFSTGDDFFVPKAIVSLLSFKKNNPEYDCFVLCSEISIENKHLCSYCGVIPIMISLKDAFYKQWQYPAECFYHFKAPEVFLSMGYGYSVYIDGDTYCSREFKWTFDCPFDIAGIAYNSVSNLFEEIGELEKVKSIFNLTPKSLLLPRLQTGVLIYNNITLVYKSYFEKAVNLYHQSVKENIPRKGDDSLLALMIAYYSELETHVINNNYNFIDYINNTSYEQVINALDESVIKDCIICHFISYKPWFFLEYLPNYSNTYFDSKWRETIVQNFSAHDIKRCFPNFPDSMLNYSTKQI